MKSSFKEIIKSNPMVLIDFSADWCGPCKALAPILKEVKNEVGDQIKIVKIDVDRNQALANKFRVMGVPTLILYKKGELVWRQSGLVPKHDLLAVINQHAA